MIYSFFNRFIALIPINTNKQRTYTLEYPTFFSFIYRKIHNYFQNLQFMTKKISTFLTLLFLVQFLFAQKETDIIGVWLNDEKDGHVEIYKHGGNYYGKIIWAADYNGKAGNTLRDHRNENAALRERKIVGTVILSSLSYTGDKTYPYQNGYIYDPHVGKTYHCHVTLKDKNTLALRGYIGSPWLGETRIWTRVSAE